MKSNSSINQKTFSRKELYDLVWSKTLSEIISEKGITLYSLRKICYDNEIPMPENGYWSKYRSNKKTEKKLLKIKSKKDNLTLILLESKSKLVSLSNEIQKNHVISIKEEGLDNLVQDLEIDLKSKIDISSNDKDSFIISSQTCLSLEVSMGLCQRGLSFYNQFIKSLRLRGHKIEIIPNFNNYWSSTFIVINGIQFRIRIVELRKKSKHKNQKNNESDFSPSGLLTFRYHSIFTREWRDSKVKLEEKIPNIIAYFELKAQEQIFSQRESQIQLKIIEKEKEFDSLIDKIKNEELQCFKNLISVAKRSDTTDKLRKYLLKYEKTAFKKQNGKEIKEKWIGWAKDKIDWYDPFINKKDELLDDVDRDTLSFE